MHLELVCKSNLSFQLFLGEKQYTIFYLVNININY